MRALIVLLLSCSTMLGQQFIFGSQVNFAAASGSSCTTVTESQAGHVSTGTVPIGNGPSVTYFSSTFIVSNAAAGTIPCKITLPLLKTGTPTFTFQVAIYTNTVVATPTAGTINGSFSSAFSVSTLTSSLTTNTILLNVSSALILGSTNSVVIKCTGSPNDFSNYFQVDTWASPGGIGLFNSAAGSTWTIYSTPQQVRYTLYQ